MGRAEIFFGRTVLAEALRRRLPVSQIYFDKEGDRDFVTKLLKEFRLNFSLQRGLPSSVRAASHQGLAFSLAHDFYLDELPHEISKNYPRILMCNHLQDIQNLGAIARSAAAFGFGLIVHESRRSFQFNAAALRVSQGLGFQLKFFEVANLMTVVNRLQKENFSVVTLDMTDAQSIYEWRPQEPLALLLGSEEQGVAENLSRHSDLRIKIPMKVGVDSLNVSQAASIAMSWILSGGR